MHIAENLRTYIRWMVTRDLPEVTQIEQEAYKSQKRWSVDDFIEQLRQPNCIGMVAESNDKIVGFMIYELQEDRLRLLKFVVGLNYRKQGIGRQMMNKLLSKLSNKRRKITSEVRESDLDAQLFMKHMGFKAVKVIRRYYDDTEEDAYIMEVE